MQIRKLFFFTTLLLGLSSGFRVAFRLDDIQDYFCSAAQIAILNTFKQSSTPITLGVIGGKFGTDPTVLTAVRAAVSNSTWEVEIASHGWVHEDFTLLTPANQVSLLQGTNTVVKNYLNINNVTTFLPPFNLFNADVVDSAKSVGMHYFSSLRTIDNIRPYYLSGQSFYRFPVGAATSSMTSSNYIGIPASETFSQLQSQVGADDFGVIMLHPQDFTQRDISGTIVNLVNNTQMQELNTLLQLVKNAYEIVPMRRLNSDAPPPVYGGFNVPFTGIPVAFTLYPIQDFYQSAAVVAIMNLFRDTATDLTAGVLGSIMGSDVSFVTYLRNLVQSTAFRLEFASYGFDLSDFSTLSLTDQYNLLNSSKYILSTYLRTTPVSFIPPNGKFNDNTKTALSQLGFTHLSSMSTVDAPPYSNPTNGIYKFNSATGADFSTGATADEVLMNIKFQAARDGFAVVTLSPSTYSLDASTVATDRVNMLSTLITKLKQAGFVISTLGRMELSIATPTVPTSQSPPTSAAQTSRQVVTSQSPQTSNQVQTSQNPQSSQSSQSSQRQTSATSVNPTNVESSTQVPDISSSTILQLSLFLFATLLFI